MSAPFHWLGLDVKSLFTHPYSRRMSVMASPDSRGRSETDKKVLSVAETPSFHSLQPP